jgi:hypothetical protein
MLVVQYVGRFWSFAGVICAQPATGQLATGVQGNDSSWSI